MCCSSSTTVFREILKKFPLPNIAVNMKVLWLPIIDLLLCNIQMRIVYCVDNVPDHITVLYLSHLDPILCLCPCEMANFGLSVKIFRAYGSFFGLHSTVVEPL